MKDGLACRSRESGRVCQVPARRSQVATIYDHAKEIVDVRVALGALADVARQAGQMGHSRRRPLRVLQKKGRRVKGAFELACGEVVGPGSTRWRAAYQFAERVPSS